MNSNPMTEEYAKYGWDDLVAAYRRITQNAQIQYERGEEVGTFIPDIVLLQEMASKRLVPVQIHYGLVLKIRSLAGKERRELEQQIAYMLETHPSMEKAQ